jgi:uncharacterized membrane protein
MKHAEGKKEQLRLFQSCATAISTAVLVAACASTHRSLPAIGDDHPANAGAKEGVVSDLRSTLTSSDEPPRPSGASQETPASHAHERGQETGAEGHHPGAQENREESEAQPEAHETESQEHAAGHAHGEAQPRPPRLESAQPERHASDPPATEIPAVEPQQHAPAEHHAQEPADTKPDEPSTQAAPAKEAREDAKSHLHDEAPQPTHATAPVQPSASAAQEHPNGAPSEWRFWEIHPKLVAFPIAFVIGGTLLEVFAILRRRDALAGFASGLLLAGLLTGFLAAAAGVLAYFTVPAHTAEAHELMQWHAGVLGSALVLLSIALLLRRGKSKPPLGSTVLAVLATALLATGAHFGGKLVLRGGAGVDPEILAPEIRGGHHHDHSTDTPLPSEPEGSSEQGHQAPETRDSAKDHQN